MRTKGSKNKPKSFGRRLKTKVNRIARKTADFYIKYIECIKLYLTGIKGRKEAKKKEQIDFRRNLVAKYCFLRSQLHYDIQETYENTLVLTNSQLKSAIFNMETAVWATSNDYIYSVE